MISNDFIINTTSKKISHNPQGSKTIHSYQDLYTYLQDLFDEPDFMKFEIPIVANSKNNYHLTNGWNIDKESLKYLNNGTLTQNKTKKSIKSSKQHD